MKSNNKAKWQNLLKETGDIVTKLYLSPEFEKEMDSLDEETQDKKLNFLFERLSEIERLLHSIRESDLGMFVGKVETLVQTPFIFLELGICIEEKIPDYRKHAMEVTENMIPKIIKSKIAVQEEDQKLFRIMLQYLKVRKEATV